MSLKENFSKTSLSSLGHLTVGQNEKSMKFFMSQNLLVTTEHKIACKQGECSQRLNNRVQGGEVFLSQSPPCGQVSFNIGNPGDNCCDVPVRAENICTFQVSSFERFAEK